MRVSHPSVSRDGFLGQLFLLGAFGLAPEELGARETSSCRRRDHIRNAGYAGPHGPVPRTGQIALARGESSRELAGPAGTTPFGNCRPMRLSSSGISGSADLRISETQERLAASEDSRDPKNHPWHGRRSVHNHPAEIPCRHPRLSCGRRTTRGRRYGVQLRTRPRDRVCRAVLRRGRGDPSLGD